MRKWVVAGVAILVVASVSVAVATTTSSGTSDEESSSGPGNGQLKHADSVSAAFGIDSGRALALHQDGVGWGAMIKLLAIAEVTGVSVEELLADVEKVDGEYEFEFGAMREGLTAAQQQALAEMPNGLGQLGHPHGMPPGQAKKLAGDEGS